MTTETNSCEVPEQLVEHDEFRQLVTDAMCCYRGVCVLVSLLRCESPDGLDAQDRAGLAVLLEGVQHRLELTCDGLAVAGVALGVDGVRELVH